MDGEALTAFLAEGGTALDAAQFLQTLTAWTTDAAATLPAPARLLLQALCRIEETDRDSATLEGNWANLWRRLDQPGDPPPLAEMVAPLVAAALVATDPIDSVDPNGPMRYRIHPGIAEAIHCATPEPVAAAVDTELAAWWAGAAQWGIEQERAGQDTGQIVVSAGLAAAPYLLRRHDWDAASYFLEQARARDSYSPIIAQAVLPPLRRITEATGEPNDLYVLASALIDVDSAEAETLLRRVYDQATTVGDLGLASAAAGGLVTLLRDQGRLRDALTLIDQKIEHVRDAGLGPWTQLRDQGQRLQILGLFGHHEQLLADLSALRDRMAELTDQPADNDPANPWSVREAILATGRDSALTLGRWAQSLDLNDEISTSERRRGASPHETARTRFSNYGPLLRLRRLTEADQLLHDCQEVFDNAGDITSLGKVYSARADLEDKRGHLQDAVELERTALRLLYTRRDPRVISGLHHNLANYLSRTHTDPGEQRAHRLAAALIGRLMDEIHELTGTLQALADELRGDADRPDAPTPPTALSDVIRLVDAGDGVDFGDLVADLCPDPDAADQALADLLATAATLPGRIDRHLTQWEPVITAVAAVATSGHTPTELADHLDELGATTDWAALVAALRRVLAGDRDREQLLAGLDDVDTVILTAVLDRFANHLGQDP